MKIEEAQEALEAEEAEDSDLEETLAQKKCIKQLVLNVAKNAKCHSNQKKEEMFSAKIALRRKKDTKTCS